MSDLITNGMGKSMIGESAWPNKYIDASGEGSCILRKRLGL